MQVIDDLAAIIMRDGVPLEASIMEGNSHPNIVNIIAHAVTENTRQKCATLCYLMPPQLVLCDSRKLLLTALSDRLHCQIDCVLDHPLLRLCQGHPADTGTVLRMRIHAHWL